jgi:hypothetical protein
MARTYVEARHQLLGAGCEANESATRLFFQAWLVGHRAWRHFYRRLPARTGGRQQGGRRDSSGSSRRNAGTVFRGSVCSCQGQF